MNVFQESCCSILGVLLVLLLQGSCVDPEEEVVHKAVGDSLELIAGYTREGLRVRWKYNGTYFAEYQENDFKNIITELFQGRLKMYKDNISVTVTDLKLQDSGRFSIVAEKKRNKQPTQYPTKLIQLQVHDPIREVKIEFSVSWLQSQNTCLIHLRCVASGDPSPSYSWIHHQNRTPGHQLNITLGRAETSNLTCTANNTISTKSTTETVECTEQSTEEPSQSSEAGFRLEYLLIVVGVGVVLVVILSATLVACCRWRNQKGPSESEAGITVYEDVNVTSPVKKRSESVINGMSIYETVEDTKPSQNLPQTLYDKINYQRHAVSACTSSPYQEVL